ncbi:MAG: OmpH family outer membrane protein [Cytophagales bacterium]
MNTQKILVFSNIVLLLLVGFLYAKSFVLDGRKPQSNGETKQQNSVSNLDNYIPQNGSRVVFINTDSLLDNLEFYQKEILRLEEKKKKMESQLQMQAQSLEKEVMAYREKGKMGTLTADEIEQTEYRLAMKNENLMRQRDEQLGKLLEEEKKLNEKLYDSIQEYVAEFNANNQYDMVLGYSKGSGVLYGNKNLDITGLILDGMNQKMKKQ